MELVEVEIIGQVITARYGTLSTGDILKTDQAFADHLVNDCKGAKWPEPKALGEVLTNAPAVEPLEEVVAAPVVETEHEVPPVIAADPVSLSKPAAKPAKKSSK